MNRLYIEDKNLRLIVFFTIIWASIYVLFAFTPSHYSVALQNFGIDSTPLFGKARPIRSDEWAVQTPYFQIAVRGHGSVTDVISPYKESLKSVFPLPILDWSLIFKPQLWGFWVFPPAIAYSLYFATLWVGCILGYTILARQLGAHTLVAFLGAIALFSSHFTQVWWTSQGATFAFAPWPLIAYLSRRNLFYKLLILYYFLTFWIFADLYPPFIISGGFALFFLLLVFRPATITLKNIVVAALAIILSALTIYLYFGELISIMRNTVYPGQRSVGGGGVPEIRLIAHIFPFFTTSQFSPLLANSNECEVAVVSTFLPLTFLCFTDLRSVAGYLRTNYKTTLLAVFCISAMLAWMVLPVPEKLGRPFLWNNVSGNRMVWGAGLFITLYLIVLSSSVKFSFSWKRFFCFSILLIAAWIFSKVGFTAIWSSIDRISPLKAIKRSWFDWIAIVPFGIIGLIIMRNIQFRENPKFLLFGGAALSGLITFGTFNPLQQAYPIFDLPNSPFLEEVRASAKSNPNGWAAMPGSYGATLNGAGIPAINHVLLYPQLEFFRNIFPDLDETTFNQAFNRYEHISLKPDVEQPYPPQNDLVIVPIEPFLDRADKK